MLFFRISVFPRAKHNETEALQANSLALIQNFFLFKEFQVIVLRIFHESSNTKIAVETCFLGGICHIHNQAPV